MATLTGIQVFKRFIQEDSPVKPGSKTIIKGTGKGEDKPSELLAVKRAMTVADIDRAASCMGLTKIADDKYEAPATTAVAVA